MGQAISKLTIKGYKSIRNLEDFELRDLNILIGPNGSGKSNFIDFFRLLRAMMQLSLPNLDSSSLKNYTKDSGGSSDLLFNGPKVTQRIEVRIMFGNNGYRFKLAPTTDETFLINDEETYWEKTGWFEIASGSSSPALLSKLVYGSERVRDYILDSIREWKIYHFHDTSKFAPMRGFREADDCEYLRFDASNIAPFLLDLRNNEHEAYEEIVELIKLVIPFFDDFLLKPDRANKVRLRWRQKGSDYPLKPHHLSDGTIRFICLATSLLQPYPPTTILIDEPELGLHPYALTLLAGLIQKASTQTQVIVSTQSAALIDHFEPEDIVIVERRNGESMFNRLNKADLKLWLEDYSLGELWQKNVFGGRPARE